MLTQTTGERPSLNLTGTAYWQDRWWLLDVETSGLDRQKDDIIALRLACMENCSITKNSRPRSFLCKFAHWYQNSICLHKIFCGLGNRQPLTLWAVGLTGISNQDLEQAASLNEAIGQLAELDGPLLLLDWDFTIPFLQNACLRCGKEFSKPCLLLDRLAAQLLGCSSRQKTDMFLEKFPPPNGLCGTPPQNPDLRKLYALSLAVFHVLEKTHRIQNTVELTDFYERGGTNMTILDKLIYDPERLSCTGEEKEACLETVRKLARLCKFFRRNGLLAAYDLAEKEDDPFLSACLFEFGEAAGCDNEKCLEQAFCAYLAAGNYRGGAFLNAVLVVKGLLLMSVHSDVPPSAWGKLLSAELRGFFGEEYRERVMDVIEQETKRPNTRESSFIPEFDHFVPLDLPQRQALLRKADARNLALALPGASAAVEKALLEALAEEARKMLEKEYLPYTHNLRVIDVTQAQEVLLKQ